RVLPIISAIAKRFPGIPVSIDTVHASTARSALDAGAMIINDVTAGRHDPDLLGIAAAAGAGLVLAHSRAAVGHLADIDPDDHEPDIPGRVTRELDASRTLALSAGTAADRIVL